jgi:hypothetical protein
LGLSPWLYLVLAHLAADFVLQPYELVKLKQRPIGLAIHSGIHTLLMAIIAAPFLPRWWIIVPLIGVIHYLIDEVKVKIGFNTGPASFIVFLVDQAAHLGILAAAVAVSGLAFDTDVAFGPPGLTAILYYGVPYVTVTFAGAIMLFQLALAYHTRSTPGDVLAPGPRVAGYAERGLTLTAILFLGPAFWWIAALWFGGRLIANRHRVGRWVEIMAGLAFTLALGFLFRQGYVR